MSHNLLVSRAHPGVIVLILDDSGSMSEDLPGTQLPKCKWVEQYTGAILKELLARSTEMVGPSHEVRARYFVRTILYGSVPQDWPAGDANAIPIDQVIKAYADSGNALGLSGGLGGTDAQAAFDRAYQFLQGEIGSYHDSFPPMVFHLTDGASATDASPVAQQIQQLTTNDGEVLIVNAFMGANTNLTYNKPDDFPGYVDKTEAGPDRYSEKLYDMSSIVPESIRAYLIETGIFPNLRQGSRLYFDVRTQDMLKKVLAVVGSVKGGVGVND